MVVLTVSVGVKKAMCCDCTCVDSQSVGVKKATCCVGVDS